MKTINKIKLIILIAFFTVKIANAQSTVVTDDSGYNSDASAMLDLNLTD